MSTARIWRSGSWLGDARSVRCANRDADVSGYCSDRIGFRPVAEANPNNLRILRGGFYLHSMEAIRCAHRCSNTRNRRISSMGFRPVAKAKP